MFRLKWKTGLPPHEVELIGASRFDTREDALVAIRGFHQVVPNREYKIVPEHVLCWEDTLEEQSELSPLQTGGNVV